MRTGKVDWEQYPTHSGSRMLQIPASVFIFYFLFFIFLSFYYLITCVFRICLLSFFFAFRFNFFF